MQLIKKIKYEYQLKKFDDILKDQGKFGLLENLYKLYNEDLSLFEFLAKTYTPKIYDEFILDTKIKPPIFWLNSFDNDDLKPIQEFLIFYLNELDLLTKFSVSSFEESLFHLVKTELFSKDYNFNDFVNVSYHIQFYISAMRNKDCNFIQSQSAFYEASDKLKFTHPNLTRGFILLIRNPYEIYMQNKQSLENDDVAKNNLVNPEFNMLKKKFGDRYIEINRQDWMTYNDSWTNENVINGFNGLVVRNEDLQENPEEIFTSILFHLNQCGLDIKVDYQKISEYVNNFSKNYIKSSNLDLSKKEIKFLEKNLRSLEEKYNYVI